MSTGTVELPWSSGYETGDYSEWDGTVVSAKNRTLDNGTEIFVQQELKIVESPVYRGSYASYHKSYGDFMNHQGTNTSILWLGGAWPYKNLPSMTHIYVAWYQNFATLPNYTEYEATYPDISAGRALNLRVMQLNGDKPDSDYPPITWVYIKVPEWDPHPMLAHIYFWDEGKLKQTAEPYTFVENIWYFFEYEFDAIYGVHRLYIQAPPYSNITSSTSPVIEVEANVTGVTAERLFVGQWEADNHNADSYVDSVTVSNMLIQPEPVQPVSANEPPVALLTVDKKEVGINETVAFDASQSSDDGQIISYFFDFGDGTNSRWTSLPTVTHKYVAQGVYNATLSVVDDFGVTSLDSSSSSVTIIVVMPASKFPSFIVPLVFIVVALVAVILVGLYTRRYGR